MLLIGMKINSISSNTPAKITKNNCKQNKNESLQYPCSIYNTKGISFCRNSIYNSKFRTEDVRLTPFQEYYIDENAVFEIAGYKIDLSSDELKDKVKNLKTGKKIIIGRDETRLENMPETVSRRHLQIKRNPNGLLSACDLNSTNGTTLKSNVTEIDTKMGTQKLVSGKYYLMPYNSVISAANIPINLNDYSDEIRSLPQGKKLIVGRSDNADIKIPINYISSQHFSIQPYSDKVLVSDLGSLNGTYFEHCKAPINIPINGEDCSKINSIVTLKKGVKTLIPNDCQIYLGNDFTLDMRNKNILASLDKQGSITIGRSYDCDLVVDDFHSHVSRVHLQLEKRGRNIIATDLNSSTDTKIIPKNEIKAFNGGVKNLELGQSNIGDCFLLSTIYALSRTPKGQQLIENMVKVDENGNYIVNLYDSKTPFVITPEQLDGQSIDDNVKRSVSGDLGIRAIERAYGRMIRSFDGENRTLFMEINDGGCPHIALKKLTGVNSTVVSTAHGKIAETLNKICKKGLNNYVLTCSTPQKNLYDGYVDSKRRFNKNHAYGIKQINPQNRTIEIINPHNTRRSHTISWQEFEQLFDFIYIGEFNKKSIF